MAKRKDASKVSDVLASLVKKTTLGTQLELARIWEHWGEMAGANLADHGRPHRVKDGVLHIEVDSPVWMHRYAYQKWRIIKRINRMAEQELVSDLFLALQPEEAPGPES